MSKKKIKLEVGKFYMIYGGNQHPAYIYEIVVDYKTYKAIKFGTSPGDHRIRIRPIQDGYDVSYVHDRPVEGTRKDFGNRELIGVKIDENDIEIILAIEEKKSLKTRRAKIKYKNKNAVKP